MTSNNSSGAAQCRQAMLDFVSGATASSENGPQMDVECGYVIKQDQDTYSMSAVQGRNMNPDNVGGMLGDFLRMYAEAHNLTVEETKGVLLRVIAERDNVLPRPASADGGADAK